MSVFRERLEKLRKQISQARLDAEELEIECEFEADEVEAMLDELEDGAKLDRWDKEDEHEYIGVLKDKIDSLKNELERFRK